MTKKRASDVDLGVEVSKGFVARVAGAGFGFVGTIIFARLLGPTDFGGFYLLLSLVAIARRPIDGINGATRKRFSEAGSPRRELLGAQLITNAGFILVALLVLLPLQSHLVSYTGLEGSVWLFVLLLVVLSSFSSFQSFLAAVGRVGVQTWIDSVRSVFTLVGQLVFVLLGYGAAGMVLGLSAGTVLVIPATHYYLRTLPSKPSFGTLRSIWAFARYSIPSTFVGKAYDRFDVLLLGFLATQAVAGHYEVAYKLTLPTTFLAGVAGSGLMARVSEFHSKGEEPSEEISNTLAFASLFAIPVFFGGLAIPKTVVVTVYGPEYALAAPLLVGLALYRVIQTQTSVLVGIVSGIDRPEWDLRAGTVALGINIVLGIALFYQIGPLGIVIATVVAESFRYALLFRVVSTRVSSTLLPRALLEQVLAGAVMFAVVDYVRAAISVRSWVELTLLLGVGSVVYFGILLFVSSHLRGTLRGIFGRSVAGYLR